MEEQMAIKKSNSNLRLFPTDSAEDQKNDPPLSFGFINVIHFPNRINQK